MTNTFLYTLAGSMLLIVATGNPRQISWRFLRVVGLLAFAITCFVTVLNYNTISAEQPVDTDWSYILGIVSGIAAIIAVLLAPFAKRFSEIFRLICVIGGASGLAAGCMSAIYLSGEIKTGFSTIIIVISQLLGAFLIGSITISWLLGHAYLTATKMTITPLRHFSKLIMWSVSIRIVFLLVTVPYALPFLAESWLIIILRVGVGLVAVGVFAYMVLDCVRLRATQSATGILYFGSLFAYIGELSNIYLIVEYGWPL